MSVKAKLKRFHSLTVELVAIFGFVLSMTSTAAADSLRYLARGDQALMQIVDLIKSAQTSIDLTYYIFDPCSVSTHIITKLLLEKSKQGVQVRIVIDGLTHGSGLQLQMSQMLSGSGIQLRYFNKGITPMVNYRTHAKVIIADGKRYITGGRNMADDYFGLRELNFIDRDVYVEGPSALLVQKKFEMFWADRKTVALKESANSQGGDFTKMCPQFATEKMAKVEAAITRNLRSTLARMPVAECSDLKFTFDDPAFWHSVSDAQEDTSMNSNQEISESKLQKKETTAAIFKFLNDDVKHLLFENWSYIPSRSIHWILRGLRLQKIPILVVTNRTTDVGGPVDALNKHYAERDHKGSQRVLGLSQAGSMNHAWSETPSNSKWMIHSKVFIANLNQVAITSFNIDPRSVHTNLETALFVQSCPKFTEQVIKETGQLIDNYEKDKLCSECQKMPSASFITLLKAWIGHELM